MGSCSQGLIASERLVQGLSQGHFALGVIPSLSELWDMKGICHEGEAEIRLCLG